jgi:hypothetical protein
MFLFLHNLALAISLLFGFGGPGYSHVGGVGMAAPSDAGAPLVSPGDSGGGMPPGTGSSGNGAGGGQ